MIILSLLLRILAACFAAEEAVPEDQGLDLPFQGLGHRPVRLGVHCRLQPGLCLSGGPDRASYLSMGLAHDPVVPTSAEFARSGLVAGATAVASTGASSAGTAASLVMKAYSP